MSGLGKPGNCFSAGPYPERLEEAGPDEDLLLRSCGSCKARVTGCELGPAAGGQEQQVMMPPLLSQLHMGKQAEEQQKFGERVSGLWAKGLSGRVPGF